MTHSKGKTEKSFIPNVAQYLQDMLKKMNNDNNRKIMSSAAGSGTKNPFYRT